MDVAVSELRAKLSDWLAEARDGQEVVITERGIPVARLVGLDETATALERLSQEGVIGRPKGRGRPKASGTTRPRPKRPLAEHVTELRD